MTKKQLEELVLQYQEREIKLEAVIQAYFDMIGQFCDDFPINIGPVEKLENLSIALFNTAEVREGIEELVDISVVYESDNENN